MDDVGVKEIKYLEKIERPITIYTVLLLSIFKILT